MVIICMVRANLTGKVGFTDDARRLNVATTRARSGVILVGHLPTLAAAAQSGMPELVTNPAFSECIFRVRNRDRSLEALRRGEAKRIIDERWKHAPA